MSTVIDIHENEYPEEQVEAVVNFLSKDSEIYKVGKPIAMFVGAMAATSVCYSVLSMICPPAVKPGRKLIRRIGINLIASYVGDKIFENIGSNIDSVIDSVNNIASKVKYSIDESEDKPEEVTEE